MKKTLALHLFVACGAMVCAALDARAAKVDVSLNAFPTNPANPNGGGTFTIVAKTDSPFGIAAINAYIKNINIPGLAYETDINAMLFNGGVYATNVPGSVNVLYGQDTSTGTLVFGVGTPSKSDGPDPLGNPLWNGATRILSGTYSSTLPMFTTSGANGTDANVFTIIATTPLPAGGVASAETTGIVRVAVPEPATAVGALLGMLAIAGRRRG